MLVRVTIVALTAACLSVVPLRVCPAQSVAGSPTQDPAIRRAITLATSGFIPEVIQNEQELLITDLSVVEDCCRTRWDGTCPGMCASRGAWTFATLASALAGWDHTPAVTDNDYAQWVDEMTVFVREWLDDHLCVVDADLFDSDARPGMQDFIDGWELVSDHLGTLESFFDICHDHEPDPPLQLLDMYKAPFRLLAIVNRIDLHQCPSSGTADDGHGGELRFIFGFLQPDDWMKPSEDLDDWEAMDATMILEYRVPKFNETDILQWAEDWHELGTMPEDFGEAFNTKLQALTDEATGTTGVPGARIAPNGEEFFNGNWLLTLRTNERAFHRDRHDVRPDTLSELGEFVLKGFVATQAILNYRHATQTVHSGYDAAEALGDDEPPIVLAKYVCENQDDILNGTNEIPFERCELDVDYVFQASTSVSQVTQPLTTLSDVPYPVAISDFVWDIDDVTTSTADCLPIDPPCTYSFNCGGFTTAPDVRFEFAIASCVGCHGREADVFDFHHVRPRNSAHASVLSEFLTGDPLPLPPSQPPGFDTNDGIKDPRCANITRFLTESELQRRAAELVAILEGEACGASPYGPPEQKAWRWAAH